MKNIIKAPLTLYEKLTIAFVVILIIIGDIGAFINVHWYENAYAEEDGFIEWLTVLPLIIATCVTIGYLIRLSAKRSWLFFLSVLFIALFSFFAGAKKSVGGSASSALKPPNISKSTMRRTK